MIIVEDFLPKNFRKEVYDLMLGSIFSWHLNAYTSSDNHATTFIDSNTIDVKQFTHRFRENQNITSDFYPVITPLLVMLEHMFKRNFENRVLKIKANLIPRHSEFNKDFYNIPHIDGNTCETFLYYVNDSDGDTFIFNEKLPTNSLTINHRISPKMGRGILFDSNILHASSPPIVTSERCVINFVFRKE